MLKTLTDTHRVILATAAARDSLHVHPLPATISKDPAAIAELLTELIHESLLVESPANLGDPVWRRHEDANATLLITAAGLAAIGILPPDGPLPTTPIAFG